MMIRPQMKRAKEPSQWWRPCRRATKSSPRAASPAASSKVGENYINVEIAEGKDAPSIVVQKQAIVGNLLPKGTLKSL